MSHLIYHPFDAEFINAFNALGPFPMGDSDDWNPFSILCLERLVSTLESDNLVVLPDGSWIKKIIMSASVPRYIPFDDSFVEAFGNLGPVPMGDAVDWNYFSVSLAELF
jgi:hypothetical protein